MHLPVPVWFRSVLLDRPKFLKQKHPDYYFFFPDSTESELFWHVTTLNVACGGGGSSQTTVYIYNFQIAADFNVTKWQRMAIFFVVGLSCWRKKEILVYSFLNCGLNECLGVVYSQVLPETSFECLFLTFGWCPSCSTTHCFWMRCLKCSCKTF